MTAVFDYYELAHPHEGVGSGFKYKTVPHITLKSIANNEPPEQEVLYDQPFVDKLTSASHRAVHCGGGARARGEAAGRDRRAINRRMNRSRGPVRRCGRQNGAMNCCKSGIRGKKRTVYSVLPRRAVARDALASCRSRNEAE